MPTGGYYLIMLITIIISILCLSEFYSNFLSDSII